MPSLSLPAVVLEADPSGSPLVIGSTHYAFLLSNPQIIAHGNSEEEVLRNLVMAVRAHIPSYMKNLRVVDLDLNELLVSEVMGS